MEECCLLLGSLWLAQLAFLYSSSHLPRHHPQWDKQLRKSPQICSQASLMEEVPQLELSQTTQGGGQVAN